MDQRDDLVIHQGASDDHNKDQPTDIQIDSLAYLKAEEAPNLKTPMTTAARAVPRTLPLPPVPGSTTVMMGMVGCADVAPLAVPR